MVSVNNLTKFRGKLVYLFRHFDDHHSGNIKPGSQCYNFCNKFLLRSYCTSAFRDRCKN